MKHIPFHNLISSDGLIEEAKIRLESVMRSGNFLGGDKVKELEQKIARHAERQVGIAVGSGSDALYFSLQAAGVKKGQAVLISSFSYPSALWALERLNVDVIPYFLDVDNNFEMIFPPALDPLIVKREIGALVVTHLFGNAQDLTPARQFCREYNIPLIEDAAQSFLAKDSEQSQAVGSQGLFSCLSFDPTKPLGSISQGGMILTNEEKSIEGIRRAAKIRRSGISNLEAAILDYRVGNWAIGIYSAGRQDLFKCYTEGLKDASRDLFVPEKMYKALPHCNPSKYVIRLNSERTRDGLREFLRGRGIETRIHYPRILGQEYMMTDCEYLQEYNSRKLTGTCLSLPFHGCLSNDDSLYIIDSVRRFFQ